MIQRTKLFHRRERLTAYLTLALVAVCVTATSTLLRRMDPPVACVGAACQNVCYNGTIEQCHSCDLGASGASFSEGCSPVTVGDTTTCRAWDNFICEGTSCRQCTGADIGDPRCGGYCGDAKMNSFISEECDNGSSCENGSLCTQGTPCSDGSVCTARSGDGCSDLCKIEAGWSCSPWCADQFSVCTRTCGNSFLDPGELCDGNRFASNSPSCAELAPEMPGATRSCSQQCEIRCDRPGNNFVLTTEAQPKQLKADQQGHIVVKIKNLGPNPETNVGLVLRIPDVVTVVDSEGGAVAGTTISWDVGTLDVSQEETRLVDIRVNAGTAPGPVEFSADAREPITVGEDKEILTVIPGGCGDHSVDSDEDCDRVVKACVADADCAMFEGATCLSGTCAYQNPQRGASCTDYSPFPGAPNYTGGSLGCTESCAYDKSACTFPDPVCNNGAREGDEECDQLDFGDESCEDYGKVSGTLYCDPGCKRSLRLCLDPPGGSCDVNGVLEQGEDCDGTKFRGQTCADVSKTGNVRCDDNCTVQYDMCVNAASTIVLAHSAQPDSGGRGDLITFTVNVSTTSWIVPSFNVPVTVTLPAGLVYERRANDPASPTWTLPVLLPFISQNITYTARISDTAPIGLMGSMAKSPGAITAPAIVTVYSRSSDRCGNGTIDTDEECDRDDFGEESCYSRGYDGGDLVCEDGCRIGEQLCTMQSLHIESFVADPPIVRIGDRITYILTVTNPSHSPQNGTVNILLPNGLLSRVVELGGGAPFGNTYSRVFAFAAGGSQTVRISGQVPPDAAAAAMPLAAVATVGQETKIAAPAEIANAQNAGCAIVQKRAVGAWPGLQNPLNLPQQAGDFPIRIQRVPQRQGEVPFERVISTDSQGRAAFANLEPGDYTVREELTSPQRGQGWAPASPGSIRVRVRALQPDEEPAGDNCAATEIVNELRVNPITITKVADRDTVRTQQEVTFTITITNPLAAQLPAAVTDVLPPRLQFVSLKDQDGADVGARNGNTITWNTDLAAGQTKTYVLRARALTRRNAQEQLKAPVTNEASLLGRKDPARATVTIDDSALKGCISISARGVSGQNLVPVAGATFGAGLSVGATSPFGNLTLTDISLGERNVMGFAPEGWQLVSATWRDPFGGGGNGLSDNWNVNIVREGDGEVPGECTQMDVRFVRKGGGPVVLPPNVVPSFVTCDTCGFISPLPAGFPATPADYCLGVSNGLCKINPAGGASPNPYCVRNDANCARVGGVTGCIEVTAQGPVLGLEGFAGVTGVRVTAGAVEGITRTGRVTLSGVATGQGPVTVTPPNGWSVTSQTWTTPDPVATGTDLSPVVRGGTQCTRLSIRLIRTRPPVDPQTGCIEIIARTGAGEAGSPVNGVEIDAAGKKGTTQGGRVTLSDIEPGIVPVTASSNQWTVSSQTWRAPDNTTGNTRSPAVQASDKCTTLTLNFVRVNPPVEDPVRNQACRPVWVDCDEAWCEGDCPEDGDPEGPLAVCTNALNERWLDECLHDAATEGCIAVTARTGAGEAGAPVNGATVKAQDKQGRTLGGRVTLSALKPGQVPVTVTPPNNWRLTSQAWTAPDATRGNTLNTAVQASAQCTALMLTFARINPLEDEKGCITVSTRAGAAQEGGAAVNGVRITADGQVGVTQAGRVTLSEITPGTVATVVTPPDTWRILSRSWSAPDGTTGTNLLPLVQEGNECTQLTVRLVRITDPQDDKRPNLQCSQLLEDVRALPALENYDPENPEHALSRGNIVLIRPPRTVTDAITASRYYKRAAGSDPAFNDTGDTELTALLNQRTRDGLQSCIRSKSIAICATGEPRGGKRRCALATVAECNRQNIPVFGADGLRLCCAILTPAERALNNCPPAPPPGE